MKRVTAVAVAAACLLLAGCTGTPQPDDVPAVPLPMPIEDGIGGEIPPTLLIAQKAESGDSALVPGVLGFNYANCVTLGDSLLVAPAGSQIDGDVVSLAGYGSYAIGDEIEVGGGLTEAYPIADLDPLYAVCAPPDVTTVSIVFVAPTT
jgi:hypothetical protein